MSRRLAAALVVAAFATVTSSARAIRPFVTDDARVVGEGRAQLETWVLVDRFVLEHNVFASYGPADFLELTLGLTQGAVHSGSERGYSITGPVMQGKALIVEGRDNAWPGFAVAVGIVPPIGHGAFTPPGWGVFSYVAVTESLFGEGLLMHANVGFAAGEEGTSALGIELSDGSGDVPTLVTAGFGVQTQIVGGLNGLAEVYYGDPYDPRTDFPAAQAGLRYVFSDSVQIDGTIASTLANVTSAEGSDRTEQWATLGLRLVTPESW